MSRYLTLEKAKQAIALYEFDVSISDGKLAFLIDSIENRLDAWLDFCAAPKTYTRKARTNFQGILTLTETPVIEVVSLDCLLPSFTNNPLIAPSPVSGLWNGSDRLATGAPNTYFEVVYIAGYDPIPEIFSQTIFDALAIAIQPENIASGLDFMSRPSVDITSLTLPGGVSQTFQVNKASSSTSTNEGRLFDKLAMYRRKIRMA